MEELFIKGGVFMWPLLMLLLVTTIVVFERIIYWAKLHADTNKTCRQTLLSNQSSQSPSKNEQLDLKDRAIKVASEADKIKRLAQDEIENYMKTAFLQNNRFMRVLDVVASTAPLLGILGTIWGIINSFNLAGSFTDIEPAAAMLGMAEAFITTAFGLIVSLSALFAHSYFQSVSEKNLVADDVFLTKLKVEFENDK